MTCYNHQAYIEQCLASILDQDCVPREVVVIDDFSVDDSAAVIEHWIARHGAPFRFVKHHANLGVCASLNEALGGADTAYFCHISGDDWIPTDRIRLQARELDHLPEETAAVLGDVIEVDAGGLTLTTHDVGQRLAGLLGPTNRVALYEQLLRENVIPAPAVMLRTSAILEVGGFDETLTFEDYDMWLNLSTKFSFAHTPTPVSYYRQLNTSLTRNPRRAQEMLTSQIRLLEKHLGRSEAYDAIIADRISGLNMASNDLSQDDQSQTSVQGRHARPRRHGLPGRRSSTGPSAS